ncbi:MAG: hypothetical protein ACREUE_09175 [Panacagrimonas sp.]
MPPIRTFSRLTPHHAASGAGRLAAAALLRGIAIMVLALLGGGLLFGCTVLLYFLLQPGLVVRVNAEPQYVAGSAALLAALYAAWILAPQQKVLILFLRRFGQSSANDALSSAMYRSLRNIARLVVLDDSVFRPISIPLKERLLIVASTFPVIVALVAALAFGASVTGTVLLEREGFSLSQRGFISIGPASDGFADQTVYAERAALLQFPQAIGLWLAILGLGFLTLRSVVGAWEARRRVESEAELHKLTRRARLLVHRALAPNALGTVATVVSSSDALWQRVVTMLAGRAAKIVLDVSYPTEPILWEIRLCLDRHPAKLLLVMNAVDNFRTTARVIDERAFAELVERSAFNGVLAYDLSDPAARAGFYRDLRDFARR